MTPDDSTRADGPRDPDEPLGADEEARVRALLASVATSPMPADVAARLQETIRDEAQARAHTTGSSPATPIGAARSRRRRLVPLLAAAAVTVGVLAVGVPVVLDQRGSQDDASSDTQADAGASGPDSEAAPERSSAGKPRNDAAAPSGRLPSLSRSAFATDVQQLTGGERRLRPSASRPTLECAGGRLVGPGAVEVSLDGSPASVISYGPDTARVFEAVGCGTGTPTTLVKATLDLR